MNEQLKLKYSELCTDIDYFYKLMDEWNNLLISNSHISKELKLKKLAEIKVKEPTLYKAMLEDINARLY